MNKVTGVALLVWVKHKVNSVENRDQQTPELPPESITTQ